MRINNRTVILIFAALIVAFTVVIVRGKLSNLKKGSQVEQVASKRILIAKRDVAAGKFVDSAADLEWADPKGEEAEGDVIREAVTKKSEFNGGIVRRPLKTGKPVAPDEITKAGDGGFLSAVLEPGMRAVSIAVTATTGAAGFIAPGDRVDLIVTHRVRGSRAEGEQDTVVSETFVRDVRVVAVDQSLTTPENKATLAKNVTVEVREAQAEQIAVAIEMGKISLALRSSLPSENTSADGRASTRDSDVSPILTKGGISPRVQVIRGSDKEDMQFIQQQQPVQEGAQ